jgi:general stress protein CsbA
MAKTLAMVFGAVFVFVGILGFVPNPLVGEGALFETNLLHDIVHILFGVILLGAAINMPTQSAKWLKIIGVLYLIIAILGFLMASGGGLLLGVVATNDADHWLHIILGIVLVAAGFAGKDNKSAPETSM